MSLSKKSGSNERSRRDCVETSTSIKIGQACLATDAGAQPDGSGGHYKPLFYGIRLGIFGGSNTHRVYFWAGAQKALVKSMVDAGKLKKADKTAITAEEFAQWTADKVHSTFMQVVIGGTIGQKVFTGDAAGKNTKEEPSADCVSITVLDKYAFDAKTMKPDYPRAGGKTGTVDDSDVDELLADEVAGLED